MDDIKGIMRKHLITKSNIEYTDYGCNFYEGCTHGCTYPCYARLIGIGWVETFNPIDIANFIQSMMTMVGS